MRVKKKGQAGQAKNFLTRTQAVRKLQISLPDFRRLCIFKGIYPREPRNNRKASKSSTASTTFYYSKDIQYLLHEPLLAKFRDHKALAKKIARSLGRGEVGDAARLEKRDATKLSLDHIIKERYPTFVDALRDLDDALSLLFLFANLPSTSTVPPKTIALCQRLCLEFQHYLILTNSLRKSFLSIKGIYYQATIQGQDILWLVPYKFVQRVTGDVDFRIMGTFVEFYATLLGFVNFRLYTSIGLIYPPRFDSKRNEQGAELDAFTLEGKAIDETAQIEESSNGQLKNGDDATPALDEEIQTKIAGLTAEGEEDTVESSNENPNTTSEALDTEVIDIFNAVAADADILPQPQSSTDEIASLFAPHTCYISRECPRAPLEFLLRAFGCKRIGWDAVLGPGAFTHDETDLAITHQIVDRPPVNVNAEEVELDDQPPSSEKEDESTKQDTRSVRPGYRIPGRTYVQPQWVWDSINEVKCLRPDLYAPGATLPPHLSPWVKPSKGEYDPRTSLAEQEIEGEAAEEEEQDEQEEEIQELADADAAGNDAEVDSEGETDIEDDNITTTPLKSTVTTDKTHGMTISTASDSASDSDEEEAFTGFPSTLPQTSRSPSADDPDPDPSLLHQRELELEAASLPLATHLKADGTPVKSILKPRSSISTSNGATAVSSDGTAAAAAAAAAHRKASFQRKKREREEEEELERRKGMLGNRKRKLYEKMVYANQSKEGEAKRLRGKRRKAERG